MKKELQEKLYNKYPKLFAEKDLPPSESCMHWGICCGDGWFNLIDGLCQSIQKIIDGNQDTMEYYKGINMPFPDWLKPIEQVVFLQVKQKFSTLRIDFQGGDERIEGMIHFTESLSSKICEKCGKFDGSVTTMQPTPKRKYWLRTLCPECRAVL